MTALTVPPQTFMAAEFHVLAAEALEAAQGVKGAFRRELERRAAMYTFAANQCDELQRVKAERDAQVRAISAAKVLAKGWKAAVRGRSYVTRHRRCCAEQLEQALRSAAILRESGEKNG
jgi:hypothetical protein